jgi:hypothetical protein
MLWCAGVAGALILSCGCQSQQADKAATEANVAQTAKSKPVVEATLTIDDKKLSIVGGDVHKITYDTLQKNRVLLKWFRKTTDWTVTFIGSTDPKDPSYDNLCAPSADSKVVKKVFSGRANEPMAAGQGCWVLPTCEKGQGNYTDPSDPSKKYCRYKYGLADQFTAGDPEVWIEEGPL